jgi:hypothetical protein
MSSSFTGSTSAGSAGSRSLGRRRPAAIAPPKRWVVIGPSLCRGLGGASKGSTDSVVGPEPDRAPPCGAWWSLQHGPSGGDYNDSRRLSSAAGPR